MACLSTRYVSGQISNEGGHKIFGIALKNPDRVDAIMNILDLDLSEAETIGKV